MAERNVILFVPVSSASGIGEYMRCRIVADALAASRDDCDIHFILSQQAPYKDDVPYPVHLVEQSPTKETAAVNRILQQLSPDVVIFDCSGRAEQYRCARELGARVVFVSQHRKKRARGFSLRRIRHIDQHWIVQFRFVDGGLTPIERLKQASLGHHEPRFIGAVYDDRAVGQRPEGIGAEPYILFSAGGGGYQLQGINAADHFLRVAEEVNRRSGIHCVVVMGANHSGDGDTDAAVTTIGSLPNADMMALVSEAEWVIAGGGDLMSQAVSLGRAVIAVEIAKDQANRIRAFVARGLAHGTASEFEVMVDNIVARLADSQGRDTMLQQVQQEGLNNGLYAALDSIDELIMASV